MSSNIKIYVSCHKESYVPKNELLYPIQVGSKQASVRFAHMLHDDLGENISHKNPMYCELTGMYWAWKNDTADYYGFFHYRRYLAFQKNCLQEDGWGNIVYDSISDKATKELCLDSTLMAEAISQYDIVTVQPRELNDVTIYEQYKSNPDSHKIEDLDAVVQIISEKYPAYKESMEKYLHSSEAYECNMFIMRRELFNAYCKWLFDILEEHEKRGGFSHYSLEQYRVSGFLGERLFGIYYTYLKKTGDIKCLELQKALFLNTDKVEFLKGMKHDNIVPIVLSSNNMYVPYLSTTVQSIVENSNVSNFYDIIILYIDISSENRQILQEQFARYSHIIIRFFCIKHFLSDYNLYVREPFSVETYARLLIPNILPDYEKVIYLDCDMVVKKDVDLLYHEDMTGYLLAAVKDFDHIGLVNSDKSKRNYSDEFLKLQNPFEYFQAGVLILNLCEFRKNFTVQYFLNLAQDKEFDYLDQDILNYVCHGRVKFLSVEWNVMMDWQDENGSRINIIRKAPRDLFLSYMHARKNPYIIHYAGHIKPWEDPSCDFARDFWRYARNTPYYEYMLMNNVKNTESRMMGSLAKTQKALVETQKALVEIKTSPKINILKKAVNRIFPVSTRRRKIAGKVKRILLR